MMYKPIDRYVDMSIRQCVEARSSNVVRPADLRLCVVGGLPRKLLCRKSNVVCLVNDVR